VDLDDYVNDPVWGFSPAEQADFIPAFWEARTVGGRRIGLPALQSAQVLFYNRSWAAELGFAGPPDTPAALRRQACAAAEAYRQDDDPANDGRGGLIFSTHPAALSGWISAFGGEIAPPDGGGYRFDTPETRQALRFLRELYDAGCAWLPESEPDVAGFAGRQGLVAAGSLLELPHLARAFERSQNPDDWTVLPFPSPQGEPAVAAYGPSFVILESDPERQLAAWLFIKWLAAPESQARLAAASGLLPVRQAALEPLTASPPLSPQYATALDLLPYARPEPSYASWDIVRWALSDAAVQLTRYYFTIDQLPALVELLHETARELHARVDEGR
jgi:multiple sugar transport system substrate-binding protein/sn-glycerol 3-phosphate transport system substrate-binding protein